ncbi:MAG: AAA family ATPase [Acidimicrobiia bacterium]|nr:AAA family ATPase [Acidimicrobiia bacterium]
MAGLQDATTSFVDALTPVLERLAPPPTTARQLRRDVVLEAFNLACGFLAADGRQTDDELWELAAAFGPHLDSEIGGATPTDIRRSGVVDRLALSIDAPSAMFELLADLDARKGTKHARTYYDGALEIGFAVVAIDVHTSVDELAAVEAWRGRLLARMQGTASSPTPAAEPAAEPPTEPPPPQEPPEPLEDLLAELDALVGLTTVKREVRLVADLTRVQQLRRERDLPVLDQSRHLVFSGNPGTGKSTVARLLARIHRSLGVLDKGHLVETDRAGLVAGFVGQTATKVVAVFDEADQGTLIIDEAYSLIRGGDNDFGREAIDTIVKLVEDRRDRVIVIMAGYPDEMAELVAANPGLRSRFPKTIHFPDYSGEELLAILETLVKKGGYELTDEAKARAKAWFDAVPREHGFGNGRAARNLFEAAVARQATRLAGVEVPTDEQLVTLEEIDFLVPGEPL